MVTINKNISSTQSHKKMVEAKIRELEKEKKKLPVIKKEIKKLQSNKSKNQRKAEKVRVLLDQLSLLIKETRMQEVQLRTLNKRLDGMKKKLI